jgi:hypothetical protein
MGQEHAITFGPFRLEPSSWCLWRSDHLNAWCELTTDGYTAGAPSR